LWRIEHSPIKLNFNLNRRGNNLISTINKKKMKFVHKSHSPNTFYVLFSQFFLFRHLRRDFQVFEWHELFFKTQKINLWVEKRKIGDEIKIVENRTFTDKVKF